MDRIFHSILSDINDQTLPQKSNCPAVVVVIIFIGIIAGLLLPMNTAVAEDQSAQVDLASLSIEDLMNIEVTSASKKPEKIADAPASVYVITHDDIERYGYKTVSEALRRVIGLYVSSDRNYDYLGVRGYSTPGDYSTKILLLIDGLRINDPIYNTAPLGDDLSLDIRSIQRIEIVKGPGSALWGTNAVLAVVNLITRRGSDIDGNRLVQNFGSGNGKMSFFEYGSKNQNGLEIAGSLTTAQSQGEHSIYFPDTQLTATGVDEKSAKRGYLSASYKGFNLFINTGDFNKTVPTGSYGTVFNDNRNHTTESRTVAALSYEQSLCPKYNGNLFARFYWNSYDFDGDYIYSMEPDQNDPPPTVMDKDMGSTKWWGCEIRYSGEISPRLSFVSGAEYTKANRLSLLNYYAGVDLPPNLDVNNTNTTKSYYLQANYDISDPLRLVLGGRLDDYSTYGRNWSPRCAFIRKLGASSALKLLWGEAFRAPNGYESNYTGAITGNFNALIPEKIATTELVWEQGFGNRSRLVTSAYRFDIKNIIRQIEDIEFENSGTIRSEGIESQFDYRMPDGSTAYVSATLLNTRDKVTHQRVPNSPNWLAGAGICLPVFAGRFYLSPEVQLVGSRLTILGNETGKSALVNLTFSTHKVAASGWNMSIRAYNLFNKIYFVPGAYEHAQDRLPQEGRTLSIETSYIF